MSVTLAELARLVQGRLRGDAGIVIHGANSLAQAGPQEITFVANAKYQDQLNATRAAAAVVTEEIAERFAGNALVVDNPALAFARICSHLHPMPKPAPGVHPTAVVHASARIAATASVAPLAVIGAAAQVGEGAVIGPSCILGAGVSVGRDTVLHPRVTVQDSCTLGNRCLVHSGVVIGADGFGFARDGSRWVKQLQRGRVVIGDDVEIGANTTIDRGTFGDTQIGNGVKLDNLVHIAHNVRIGDDTAIAACVGIAGSTTIGKRCTIAGQAGVKDHLHITDDVHITAASAVLDSIDEPGMYSSSIRAEPAAQWRRNAVRLSQLDGLAQRLRQLEKKLQRFFKE
jgi:UDP-3-O-[3-hydroxymyristoyl] glucosamine N-acyltransferase